MNGKQRNSQGRRELVRCDWHDSLLHANPVSVHLMSIPPPKPLNQFPPFAPQIDWTNPLTKGLRRAITPSAGMVELVTRRIATVNGTINRNPAGFSAATLTGNNIEVLDLQTAKYTCFAVATAQTAGSNSPRTIISKTSSFGADYQLILNGGNQPQITYFTSALGSSVTIPVGSTAAFAGTYDDVNLRVYAYGKLTGTQRVISATTGAGNTYFVPSYTGNGVLLAAIWNR
ncbi:MAG: hypothetical protein ACKO8H_03700, partial [Microcystis panniformis]